MQNNIWIYNYLTTRELALLCWLVFLIFALLKNNSIRVPLLNCVKIFLSKPIQKVVFLVLCYFLFTTFCLYKFNLWDYSLAKDSLVWFIFSGLALLFRYSGRNESIPPLKTFVTDNLKFTLFFEYVFNLYTFPFFVEFLFIPSQVFIALMSAFTGTKEEYTEVKKLFEGIMILLGGFVFCYCIYMSIIHFSEVFNLKALKSIRLPLYYSITFFPLLFGIKITSEYQISFVQLRTEKIEDRHIREYFKSKVIRTFKFNYIKLQNFVRYSNCQNLILITKEDVNTFISLYIKRNTLNKFSSNTPGFNPRLAEKFMEEEGFTVDSYKYNGYDEGYGEYYTSMYKKFEGLNVDLITYSLEGNNEKVLKIKLELDEFVKDSIRNKTHMYFVKCVKTLYGKTFNKAIPKNILKSVKSKEKKSFCIDNNYIKIGFETYELNPNLISYTFIISVNQSELKQKQKRKIKNRR